VKTYRLIITETSFLQIEAAFAYIQVQSQNADHWLNELYDKVSSLCTMPERFGVARENDSFDLELRCLRHHSHRILYTVDQDHSIVRVHAVLHGSKEDLRGDEF